ncbi:MAG: flagellar hook-basal body protein [Acetobacterium sp.]
MIRGFYTATRGLISQQTYLNNIANNIANVNTTAFKPQQTAFSSLLYSNVNGGSGTTVSTGSGIKVEKTGIDFTPGTLEKTSAPLDCAILNDGFFAIQNKETNEITYTRNGAFNKSVEGNALYLVDSSGNYVLGTDSQKIDVSQGFDSTEVGLFNFSNPYGLKLLGNSQFQATAASGQGTIYPEGSIKEGFLESSASDISSEMVKMIEASKSFSFNAKMLQTTDEMEKIVNQLR